jgi:hypothetical protein
MTAWVTYLDTLQAGAISWLATKPSRPGKKAAPPLSVTAKYGPCYVRSSTIFNVAKMMGDLELTASFRRLCVSFLSFLSDLATDASGHCWVAVLVVLILRAPAHPFDSLQVSTLFIAL